jgi:hypothetical protein
MPVRSLVSRILTQQFGMGMNFSNPQSLTAENFTPLVEVDMDASVFGASWSHCDHLSSYVARMVSHNRSDSLLYSNLLSSALNELLETAFRTHAAPGKFRCRLWRHGAVDRVELIIPCQAEQVQFYLETIAMARRTDAVERYRNMLFSEDSFDTRTGLLELAVDYAAEISASPDGEHAIRLIADLTLEAAGH